MPETVTIQLSDGQPFTATTQDRWIILPTGRLPHSSTVGELEWMMNAKINDDALVIPSEPMKKMGWCKTDLANAELNAQIDGGSPLWFAIRPTEGRSWSDIAPKQPAEPSGEVARLTAERDALLAVLRMVGASIATDSCGNIRVSANQVGLGPSFMCEHHNRTVAALARAVMERKETP